MGAADRAIVPAANDGQRGPAMGQRIDQFCEDLRLKLTGIDSDLHELSAKIEGRAATAEQDVRSHLQRVRERIDQDRTRIASSENKAKAWIENKQAATGEAIAEWKAKREVAKLQARAEDAESYAAAALAVAMAAVDDAEQAALEAWLARQDAIAAESN